MITLINANIFSLLSIDFLSSTSLFPLNKKKSFPIESNNKKIKRGDRNELNSLTDRAIINTQSPTRSSGLKYSSIPAFVSLSTPEPFSYKPTSSVTQRTSRPSTVTIPSTTPSTTTRTTEYQFVTTRFDILIQ